MQYLVFQEDNKATGPVFHFEIVHGVGLSHCNGESFAMSLNRAELTQLISEATKALAAAEG